MRYPPALRRLRAQHYPHLRLHFPTGAPGSFGVDLGEALYQVALRELLEQAGLRGRV